MIDANKNAKFNKKFISNNNIIQIEPNNQKIRTFSNQKDTHHLNIPIIVIHLFLAQNFC